jgi:hypothetical protein
MLLRLFDGALRVLACGLLDTGHLCRGEPA